MVTQLKKRVPVGMSDAAALFYVNEAFRKLNQFQKGGFIWQVKTASRTFAGGQVETDAPDDFDPGKTAVLISSSGVPVTGFPIPYLPWKDFVLQTNFQVIEPSGFSAWTYRPSFSFTAPTSYKWKLVIGPAEALPFPVVSVAMTLTYHAVSFPTFASAANVYFPTPDQFDSLIVDLAVAQAKQDYNLSNFDRIAQQANQGIAEIIDTYRSERYDLAGFFDVKAQAQEKEAERNR